MSDIDFVLRYPREEDLPFIFSAWIKGSWSIEPNCYIKHRNFKAAKSKQISNYLKTCQTLLLAHPDDPDQLYGFICHDKQTIHYVYIKQEFRRQGLLTSLLDRLNLNGPLIVSCYFELFKELRSTFNLSYLPDSYAT